MPGNPKLHFIYSSLLLVSLQKISTADMGCRWNVFLIPLLSHTYTQTWSTVTINIWPCPRAFSNMNFKQATSSPRPKWPPSDFLQNYSSDCHKTVASSQNMEWVPYAGFPSVLIKTVKFFCCMPGLVGMKNITEPKQGTQVRTNRSKWKDTKCVLMCVVHVCKYVQGMHVWKRWGKKL